MFYSLVWGNFKKTFEQLVICALKSYKSLVQRLINSKRARNYMSDCFLQFNLESLIDIFSL